MSYTPKQERNGTDTAATGQNSAMPGADVTAQVSAMKGRAEAAADALQAQGHTLITNPVDFGGNNYGLGSMWDWDSGLAIPEQPGEQ